MTGEPEEAGPVPALVLFDMDDVLCDYSRRTRADRLAALAGCTADEVLAAIWQSGFEALGDAGTLGDVAYLHGFGERIGYRLTLDEWIGARRAATAVRPDMLALVRRLTVPSAVLTNNPALIAEHIDRIAPGLSGVFGNRIYASASLEAAKPDAACFLRCLEGLGIAPERTLFVDDLPENVAGARRAGLMAHRFVSAARLAEVLQGLGVLRPG